MGTKLWPLWAHTNNTPETDIKRNRSQTVTLLTRKFFNFTKAFHFVGCLFVCMVKLTSKCGINKTKKIALGWSPVDVFNTFLRLVKLLLDLKVIVQIANFVGELAILGRVQVLV